MRPARRSRAFQLEECGIACFNLGMAQFLNLVAAAQTLPQPWASIEFWFNRYQTFTVGLFALAALGLSWLQTRTMQRQMNLLEQEAAQKQAYAKNQLHNALDQGIAAASDFNMFVQFQIDPDRADLPFLWTLQDIDRTPERHPADFANFDDLDVLNAAVAAFRDTRKVDTVRAYIASVRAYQSGMLDPARTQMMAAPILEESYIKVCRAIDEWRRLAALVSKDLSTN